LFDSSRSDERGGSALPPIKILAFSQNLDTRVRKKVYSQADDQNYSATVAGHLRRTFCVRRDEGSVPTSTKKSVIAARIVKIE
jgi:hypothetical protein